MDLFGDIITDKAIRIGVAGYLPPYLNVLLDSSFKNFHVISFNLVATQFYNPVEKNPDSVSRYAIVSDIKPN